jgi:Fatty acid desaturase
LSILAKGTMLNGAAAPWAITKCRLRMSTSVSTPSSTNVLTGASRRAASGTIDAGPVMAFMTGNLSHQIEHHLYRILPSNRLAEISVRVRQVCDKPYSGQLLNGALRRVQGGCQLGQGDAARAQRHGLDDLDHSVDRAMRANRHAADASEPFRRVQPGTCNEAGVTVQYVCDPDIRLNIHKYVHERPDT